MDNVGNSVRKKYKRVHKDSMYYLILDNVGGGESCDKINDQTLHPSLTCQIKIVVIF